MKELALKLIMATIAVLSPIYAVMLVVGILIISDLITGIVAAKYRGEKIQSSVMRRTITKILVYQLAVVLGFLLGTYILEGLIPVSKIVASVIGMVEFKSILENMNDITGNNIFKTVLKKLGSDNDSKE